MARKIEHLLNLLDDENPEIAGAAMAELLNSEEETMESLQHLQETDNLLLRRRVHQLQAAIGFRRRRRIFAEKMKTREIGLLEGLIDVHLLWYDNDSADDLRRNWRQLEDTAAQYGTDSIEKIAYFMRKCSFKAASDDEFSADYFCLGSILDTLVGADFILSAIAMEIAERHHLELKMVRSIDTFLLVDPQGQGLLPVGDWRLVSQVNLSGASFWNTEMILKMAVSMLFMFAAASDSFRYINTIGRCLSQAVGQPEFDFLPYPFNPKK